MSDELSIGEIILRVMDIADTIVLNRASMAHVGDLVQECVVHGLAIKEKLAVAVTTLASRMVDFEDHITGLNELAGSGQIGDAAVLVATAKDRLQESIDSFVHASSCNDDTGVATANGVMSAAAAVQHLMDAIDRLRGFHIS